MDLPGDGHEFCPVVPRVLPRGLGTLGEQVVSQLSQALFAVTTTSSTRSAEARSRTHR
jgi:hypothetical protein